VRPLTTSGDPRTGDFRGTWLWSIEFPGREPFRFLMTVDPDGSFNAPLPDHSSQLLLGTTDFFMASGPRECRPDSAVLR